MARRRPKTTTGVGGAGCAIGATCLVVRRLLGQGGGVNPSTWTTGRRMVAGAVLVAGFAVGVVTLDRQDCEPPGVEGQPVYRPDQAAYEAVVESGACDRGTDYR